MRTIFGQDGADMRETESEASGWEGKIQRMFGAYTGCWFVRFLGDEIQSASNVTKKTSWMHYQ